MTLLWLWLAGSMPRGWFATQLFVSRQRKMQDEIKSSNNSNCNFTLHQSINKSHNGPRRQVEG